MKAKDVMTTEVVTIRRETGVERVAQLMLTRRISGIPVVDDDDRLVGMVTEGDLMRRSELHVSPLASWTSVEKRARDYARGHGREAKDVMTAEVITIGEETPVGEVAALLEEAGIKRLPVMRGGRLIGIVSRADLLRALAVSRPEPVAPGDEALRRAVMTRVHEDAPVRDRGLNATVANGVVHLWGSLPSDAERDAVVVVARNVQGVTGVVDHTRIEPVAGGEGSAT